MVTTKLFARRAALAAVLAGSLAALGVAASATGGGGAGKAYHEPRGALRVINPQPLPPEHTTIRVINPQPLPPDRAALA